MGTISSGIGLISGLNTSSIIDQLISIEQRPVTILQTRIASNNARKAAYTGLSDKIKSIKSFGTDLKNTTAFEATSASSSDESVLTATTTAGAAAGSYQFQVARMVTAQQAISNGFSDLGTTNVGAGTITVEMGGGEISSQTLLSQLRGGAGVSRGQFRITDRSGNSAVIDTSDALTVSDVLRKINTNINISVKASVDGDKLRIKDTSGGNSSNFIIQDLGDGQSAADLGITFNTNSTNNLGGDINYISRNTAIDRINDGRGIRRASTGADFTVATQDGSSFDVTLGSVANIGAVIDAINSAGGGKVTASIASGGNGITLTDNTNGGDTLSLSSLTNSHAIDDLGLNKAPTDGVISGDPIIAGINTTLISSLRGGTGLSLGTISITDRTGAAAAVSLGGATNVQDILDRINNAGIGVTASLKTSGNGISIKDTSGGSGNLVISDSSGSSASQLGIAGTFGAAAETVDGANLQHQWFSGNTLRSSLGGGAGVAKGKFKITNASGASATVDLSQGNELRMSDIMAEINSKGIGVTASINANGDGLLLTDSSGGAGHLKVEDVDSTTAQDLNILGTASANTIDGSWEKSVTITATDKLSDVQSKINSLGYAVGASVLNDGSSSSPYRLSLTARNSGQAGRISIDGGATGLKVSTLIDAQDAAVFVGQQGSTQPLVITSSKNQLTDVIPGVTIDLHSVSSSPVTLTISQSSDDLVTKLGTFVDNFNTLQGAITSLTGYDSDKKSPGLLLGESTVYAIQTATFTMLNGAVDTGSKYRTLGDVGVSVGDGGQLAFDESKFRAAFADNPDAVTKLFTLTSSSTSGSTTTTIPKGFAAVIEQQMTRLIDPVDGLVTLESKQIDSSTDQFNSRITDLNKLIDSKRTRLEKQFANLESVLANLQGQQSALSALSGTKTTSSSSSK